MSPTKSDHEFSILLVRALRDLNMVAQTRGWQDYLRGRAIYVEVQLGRQVVAVETAISQGHEERSDAESRGRNLIFRRLADSAVIVCHPEGLTENSLYEAEFKWRVIQRRETADSGWTSGTFDQFVFFIELSSARPEVVDAVAMEMADTLVKADGRVLAAALPLVAATSRSDQPTRRLLGHSRHLAYIIASHDPGRVHFSTKVDEEDRKRNKAIGAEVLVVGRRWDSLEELRPPVRVVNLAKNPTNHEEAVAVAESILNDNMAELGYGTVQEIGPDEVEAGDWGRVRFLSPYLYELHSELMSGRMFSTTRLGKIASIGPSGRVIRKVFSPRATYDSESVGSLWRHSHDTPLSILATPDRQIVPKEGMEEGARKYWNRRTNLLFSVNLHLTQNRIVAVWLEEPTVGSRWINCRVRETSFGESDYDRALCLFLNSSIGILTVLGTCTGSERLDRPNVTLTNLSRLPVPDVTQTDIKALVDGFDRLCRRELMPLAIMDHCPTRMALDEAVTSALGISPEIVARVRQLLVEEPSVTGVRFGERRDMAVQTGLAKT